VIPGIFDHGKSPDEIYNQSEFLFWTMVITGARTYKKDPTIVEALINPVKALMRESLFDPLQAISTIQAVLLLSLWPTPINTTFKDQTHAMTGAAMNLALQKGLSKSSRKQDFAGVPLKYSESDQVFRARLWMYCVIIFQG
jgi:transcriptional regulatory protein LEU3